MTSHSTKDIADNGGGGNSSSSSSSILISTILSTTSARDACLSALVSRHLSTTTALLVEIDALDEFRRTCPNLYHKVRALFFLYALHRFHLPKQMESEDNEGNSVVRNSNKNLICPLGYDALLDRRFEEAIDHFLVACSSGGTNDDKYCRQTSSMPSLSTLATDEADDDYSGSSRGSTPTKKTSPAANDIPSLVRHPPTDALSSALAKAYHSLALQTLADQVRSSVRSFEGNGWMFAPALENESRRRPCDRYDHPRRIAAPELIRSRRTLCERTPVRMDLSHAGWSDIFFLGMDYPDGARVINCSVDLMVRGSDTHQHPTPVSYTHLTLPTILRV